MLYAHQSRLIFPPKFPQFPAIQTRSLTPHSSSSSSPSLLNLCENSHHLRQIHARYILHGLHQNLTLSSKLIDSYANLGLLNLSEQVFNSITNPSSFLYNTVLNNMSKFGEYEKTLLVYQQMVMQCMYPNEDTYSYILKSCSCLNDVKNGKKVHGQVVKLGFDSFDDVGDALVEFYMNCGGNFENEQALIERKLKGSKSYWNSLISGAAQNGKAEESFKLFKLMRMEGVEPDAATSINLLRSSVDLNSFEVGRVVHCVVVVSDLWRDLSVNTALLSMYGKLGSLEDARLLFEKMPVKDCVVWNIMISAYSRSGCPKESLELLMCMGRSGIRTDFFTAIAAVSSIARIKYIEWGKQMHAHVLRNGLDYQVSVHNSLIDMYCECEHLSYATNVFESVKNKTVVSWSSMIKGYVTHDQSLEALTLFSKMKLAGIEVDFVTIINVLPACVNIAALEHVKYLHGYSMKLGLNSLSSVNTAILVSYAKCGCIEMAGKLFDEEKIDSKDIITWNSMISAYGKHGDWSQCFKLYNKMKQSYLRPDLITFLGLLTACVNSGLVEEGREIFKEMKESYGYEPSQEHYASMVNLLGRAGHMNEAGELVKTMPFKPDARVWGPLLSACNIHSETKLAEFTAEKLITMEPENAGNYVLLSNIYAAAGKWDGVAKMRTFLRDRGLKKTPGCSWIEIGRLVHEFRAADRSHPKANDIYTILGILEFEIMEAREEISE
ncbi:Pentatricopeptide repeat-containing protein [Melia azedarach]|uniref:Pentatricopeptide repeat-containing protein n=1 Tax=Melia azedarach TaxID=155640 RepID=A0ACC1WVD5_MELAZ|nr:Pentatricopeptide repeat-containing protein [Melia azedarach]